MFKQFLFFSLFLPAFADLHSQECCTISQCSSEKFEIVSQILNLAMQIQNSINKANSSCTTMNEIWTENPITTIEIPDKTTATWTTLSTTAATPSTTTTTTSTTSTSTTITSVSTSSTPSTTMSPSVGDRYNVLTDKLRSQTESHNDCAAFGKDLVNIDTYSEYTELKSFLTEYLVGVTETRYFWTSGWTNNFTTGWFWAYGNPVDLQIGQPFMLNCLSCDFLLLEVQPGTSFTLRPAMDAPNMAYGNNPAIPVRALCEQRIASSTIAGL